MNELLFVELGYRGNQANYYDARNSCLQHVVPARMGIPITLAVVYLEVARRLGFPVFGVGLPGHFVVEYDDGRFRTYVDVFDGGQLMTAAECAALVKERANVEITPGSEAFRRAGKRDILLRMLANLRAVFLHAEDWLKAYEVLSWLIRANPASADEYRQRAVAGIRTSRLRSAAADLERYLRLAPAPRDREDVVRQLEAIHRKLGSLN
jgi:regulator of sirC expression with transglutaminase-like and TPR domain